MFRRARSVLDLIRDAMAREVHFADVAPARGRPTTLRIEGPGALSGAGERAVLGHERALRRAGFRTVECLGVDPHDARGRHGRLRAAVPETGAPWIWERTTGEALQTRIIAGEEPTGPLPPPVLTPAPPPAAAVLPLRPRSRR